MLMLIDDLPAFPSMVQLKQRLAELEAMPAEMWARQEEIDRTKREIAAWKPHPDD